MSESQLDDMVASPAIQAETGYRFARRFGVLTGQV